MHNKVILLGYYGGDETHCLSAWQSTNVDMGMDFISDIPYRIHQLFESTIVNKKKSPAELLKMLAESGHHTPFEKSCLHFQLTADIASHIHIIKHRIGLSVNSECLTGDNVITFVDTKGHSNKKLRKTVEELFDKWSNGRPHQLTEKDKSYSKTRISKMDLRVLNEQTGYFTTSHIKDIWEKGLQDVYKITLENGNTLKCTNNHKIYTPDGFKTILSGLKVGELVGCNGIKTNIATKPWTSEDFIPYKKEWGKERKLRNNKLKVHFSPIISIVYVGKEMTYDIEVEGTNNNFIANNIVVHNSARYKELTDKWYLPNDWKDVKLTQPIFLDGECIAIENEYWFDILNNFTKTAHDLYHQAIEDLTPKLGRKRAKETARYFLPYNKQLDFDCMFNFRSFMHFQELRNSEHAQHEIHVIAEQMLTLIRDIPNNPFKYSLEAFGY